MSQLPARANAPLSDVPLGTAEWFRFPQGDKPVFRIGDLWLSRLPTGEPVGFHDDRHVLICSGTRAGKGTSVIIPNICLWPGSIVVLDPKGENAIVTARRRGKGSAYTRGIGQTVRLLDPFREVQGKDDAFDDLRVSFNPLAQLQADNEEAVDEAAKIAASIIVSEQSADPFWDDSARGLFAKLCLHVATWREIAPADRNLLTVRRLLQEGEAELRRLMALDCMDPSKLPSGLALLFENMARNKAFGGVVARAGELYLNMELGSPRVLFSVLSVACTNTDFLDGPAMQRCLARSDFPLRELKTNPRGVSLYLCLPQRYMPTHFRWLRMMTTLILAEMERTRAQPASGHQVLMVLDEFAGLKRMPVIENAAAQIAGFGVKLMFVVQTLAQLKDVYRDNWETLVANAGVKLFFGNDDHFTRDYVSKLAGECEVVRTAASTSETSGSSGSQARGYSQGQTWSNTLGQSTGTNYGERSLSANVGGSLSQTAGGSASTSSTSTVGWSASSTTGRSETVHKRALITPDEVGRLFGDRRNPMTLALIAGMQPLALRRSHYFADDVFTGKFDPHPDHKPPLTWAAAAAERERRKQLATQAREREIAEAVGKIREKEARLAARDAAYRERVALAKAADAKADIQRARQRRKWQRQAFMRETVWAIFWLLLFTAPFWWSGAVRPALAVMFPGPEGPDPVMVQDSDVAQFILARRCQSPDRPPSLEQLCVLLPGRRRISG